MESVRKLFTPLHEAWEQAAAPLIELWTAGPTALTGLAEGNPWLAPIGAATTAWMKWKQQADEALAAGWAAFGLSTRREQERMLHLLSDLQSRLVDLEERLEVAQRRGTGEDT